MTRDGGHPTNVFNISWVVLPNHPGQHQWQVGLSAAVHDILVGGLATRDIGSPARDAERRPALFRELRPSCTDASRRAFCCGRGTWLPAPLGAGPELEADLALFGAFFADIEGDGDGDGRAGPAPLVWMPGGTGRLALPAGTAVGAAVATGPIAWVGEGFARAGRRGGRCTAGCSGS